MKRGVAFSMRYRLLRKSRQQILDRRKGVKFLKSLKGKTPLFPEAHARAKEMLENAIWDEEVIALLKLPLRSEQKL